MSPVNYKLRGLASAFLQVHRGITALLDYLSPDEVPINSRQQLRSVQETLDRFRLDLLAMAEAGAADEGDVRFHASHHALQVSVMGACLLAEHFEPHLPATCHAGLQATVSGLRSVRWDIPYSYIQAIALGTQPQHRTHSRAVLELPYLPHAVLGVVGEDGQVLIYDETAFSFGTALPVAEYEQQLRQALGAEAELSMAVLPKEVLEAMLQQYFTPSD